MAETNETLEGRILAHRKVLAILARHAAETSPDLLPALRELSEAGFHEEDPGAVPGDGYSIEGALVDEVRRILALIEGERP